jgi:hypothetical protein
MKIKTLESRLKKINSKIENNKFSIYSSVQDKTYQIKILKNSDSDEFFALALETSTDDIIFHTLKALTNHIFNYEV